MWKNLRSLVLIVLCTYSINSMAQTGTNRYLDEVFTDVTVTSDVEYGKNFTVLYGLPPTWDTLLMDVYEPTGDTLPSRPLIIMCHAGSFLPKGLNQLPFGNKTDSSLIEICTQFAKRGWVAVSMNYRLGWNALSPSQEVKANTIINAVYRAMQDAKACVRYFKKDAFTTNTFKIDSTKITVGGSNSGGYLALAYGALNDTSELNIDKLLGSDSNSFINQSYTGGFDGEGGTLGFNNYSNPGHTSEVQLILNLGGAMGDTSWQEAGEIPIVAFHGVADSLTPFVCAVVIVASTGDPIIEVCGSYATLLKANSIGNQDLFVNAGFTDPYTVSAQNKSSYEGLFPFYGAANGFEPWGWYDSNHTKAVGSGGSAANPYASKAKALFYIDTIMGYFCPRAVEALGLPKPVGINESSNNNYLQIYPNPASTSIRISNSNHADKILEVKLLNATGQIVRQESAINSNEYLLERNDLPIGLYFINVKFEHSIITRKVIFN